ncbi:MAG TPA: sigma-70 family RNA polymerase sigma factor [Urbifossiella sp.]|nr:sigma-70 family RNA polymerase sigma factor [Urbifossiella sp.]
MTDRSVEGHEGGGTSLSLLARVRADDQSAWVRLVDLYGRLIYDWCLRGGLQPEDAADVGQEVFIVVARKIQEFRRDRPGDSFRGWLYTITRNKIRDWARARGEGGEGGSDSGRLGRVVAAELSDPDESSVCDDRRLLVRRAIELVRGEFEPKTWEAFWRAAVDGQPAEVVAADLGMTRDAVYIAKGRVRRRLLGEFGDLLELDSVRPSGQVQG